MDMLKPNHRWQVTWRTMIIVWTQFYVSSACSTMGTVDRIRGVQQIHTSSIYIDLHHPARCNGFIRQLNYCYHVTNLGGFVSNAFDEALVQIWREEQEKQELELVHEYNLKQDTSSESRGDFICQNKTLNPEDYIAVNENDVFGVTLPVYSLTSPLQLISSKPSAFGLYWKPLSAIPDTRLQKSSLTMDRNVVLHLFAFIDMNITNSINSTEKFTTTSDLNIPTIVSSRPLSPSSLKMRSTQTQFSPLLTHSLTLSPSSYSKTVSPTQLNGFQSLSSSRGGKSQQLTSTHNKMPSSSSTFLTNSFTTTSLRSVQATHTTTYSLQVLLPQSTYSRITHTKSHKVTESNPPSSKPATPEVGITSNSTLVAGIVAFTLLLTTVAACTLIGCVAIFHCKNRPHKVDSTAEERDDKDSISLKDVSPTTSLDKSPHKGIVVSRIDGHLIAELNSMGGNLPAILPITAESENSSIYGGSGTAFPAVIVLPPTRKDQHLDSVVPPPQSLSAKQEAVDCNSDHDYEELMSQRNSINEAIANKIQNKTPTGSEGAMTAADSCRQYQNSSLIPIIAKKKEQTLTSQHDYDEPNDVGIRKVPYHNGVSIIVNRSLQPFPPWNVSKGQAVFTGRRRALTVAGHGPRVLRGRTSSSKTKDYEVPVSSYGHPVLHRASSASESYKHNRSQSARVSKPKGDFIEQNHGRQEQPSLAVKSLYGHSSQSIDKEEKQEQPTETRSATPNSTGSSMTIQSTEEADSEDSYSMDGPYRDPPVMESEILALLKQVDVQDISLKSIKITPRELIGHFGSQPVKTTWRKSHDVTVEVSVKAIATEDPTERTRLLQEGAILAQFRHPNVVRLHGIVNKENMVMLVIEHFEKEDLGSFLVQTGRNIIPSDTPKLLLHFSQQVALGMQYLASKGFVHRDLAARNIYVTNSDTCKVGALWKSKELSKISDGEMLDKIFVKWTSPEAMYHHRFSTASDIWSYGCLLYEIWSLGRIPFKYFSNREVIEKVDSGYRLAPPPGCPKSIYELMIRCWNPRPLSRPTFKEILHVLLKDENQTLQIPIRDACTHDSSIVLGAELEAGKYMYLDLQQTYTAASNGTPSPTSKGKRSDYDHIDLSGQNFYTSFPTSSADIECMYKGQDSDTVSMTSIPSPPGSLYSKSPTRNRGLELANLCHQHLIHETLDSDYEEIDAR